MSPIPDEQNLATLAEMCGNVTKIRGVDSNQWETAHALRVEYLRLELGGSHDGKAEIKKESLKKRMAEFLAGLPVWMTSGIY